MQSASLRPLSRPTEPRLCTSRWLQRKPYVVLIGPVGSGKTSLAQKLSGKEGLGVQGFGDSATRVSTTYQTTSFQFADTPGYLVMDDKIDHAVNIICALESQPLSRIFIICCLENRIDTMVRNVLEILQPLVDFRDMITVIVTFWDRSDGNGETRRKIETDLQRHLGVSSILFSQKNTKRELLEQLMKDTLLENPRELHIPVDKISTYFDIKPNNIQIIKSITSRSKEYCEIAKDVMEHANKIQKSEEKEDFVFLAQIALKEMITQIKQEFAAEFNFTMLDAGEFAFTEELHARLIETLKCYRSFCYSFKSMTRGCNSKGIPLRQCPYCNEVWMKLQGCDGLTKCGSRVTEPEPMVGTNYGWTFSSKRLQERFSGCLQCVVARRPVQRLSVRLGLFLPRGKGVGCGNSISWKDMKPYPMPSEMLTALHGTDDVEVANPQFTKAAYTALQFKKDSTTMLYNP